MAVVGENSHCNPVNCPHETCTEEQYGPEQKLKEGEKNDCYYFGADNLC